MNHRRGLAGEPFKLRAGLGRVAQLPGARHEVESGGGGWGWPGPRPLPEGKASRCAMHLHVLGAANAARWLETPQKKSRAPSYPAPPCSWF